MRKLRVYMVMLSDLHKVGFAYLVDVRFAPEKLQDLHQHNPKMIISSNSRIRIFQNVKKFTLEN